MQVELRQVKAGIKKDVRLRTDEEVERVELEAPASLSVLYWDATNVALMDAATFEQTDMPRALLGSQADYLQEGMLVTVEMYQGTPARISIPARVTFEVAEVTPLATNSAKENRDIPAVLANGLRVKVPKFIKAGDKIVIDTPTGKYVSKE